MVYSYGAIPFDEERVVDLVVAMNEHYTSIMSGSRVIAGLDCEKGVVDADEAGGPDKKALEDVDKTDKKALEDVDKTDKTKNLYKVICKTFGGLENPYIRGGLIAGAVVLGLGGGYYVYTYKGVTRVVKEEFPLIRINIEFEWTQIARAILAGLQL